MIKITIEGKIKDFLADLSRFISWAVQHLRRRMREKLNGKKSGKLYPKRRGQGFVGFHQASAPGEPPASDTKAFENSLEIQKKGSLEWFLFSNLGYPGLLEEGTKFIKPRPLWLTTVDEEIPTLENELARVLA